jgi:hypothetical protein
LSGECKFGEGCSFFHNDNEKRRLIDPLPNLPDGVTLPPMPEKLKNYKQKKAQGYNYDSQHDGPGSPHGAQYFNPIQAQMPMIPISSLTEIMALGGFNPNKYMSPMPIGFNNGFGTMPPHMMYQQQM